MPGWIQATMQQNTASNVRSWFRKRKIEKVLGAIWDLPVWLHSQICVDLGYLADKSQTAPKIYDSFFKTMPSHFSYTIFLPLADVECDRISILFKFLYQTAVILAQLFGAEKFFKISFFLARGKTKYHIIPHYVWTIKKTLQRIFLETKEERMHFKLSFITVLSQEYVWIPFQV